MQLKEIHTFLKELVSVLRKKESLESTEKTLPKASKEYTKGQLYEAEYILEIVEKIIYENARYVRRDN